MCTFIQGCLSEKGEGELLVSVLGVVLLELGLWWKGGGGLGCSVELPSCL